MRRLYSGVGLVTLATLLLELLLTRIFSVTLYYHFAFMVISLALFGLGLSGVVLYLHPERYPEEKLVALLSRHSRAFAGTTIVSLIFVVNHAVTAPLEATSVGHFSWQTLFQLTFLYLFAALPFYYGGMTVSLALFHLRERIATLYCYDLVGASLACLLLDPVLRALGGPSAVLLTAFLAALAAVVFGADRQRWKPERRSIALAGSLLVLLGANARWDMIDVGSFKGVQREHLVFSRWNALSRIEVQQVNGFPASMTIDAMAQTALYSLHTRKVFSERNGITSLVHTIRTGANMLIIGPGGGVDVLSALDSGQRRIALAEINPIILNEVMLGRFRDYSGDLYGQPQVLPFVAEGRSFVRRGGERYDIILATLVDTWAATAAGAFTLSENHLYTVEAFQDYLDHLTPAGVLSMSRWVRTSSMEFVRLASLARAALARRGVSDPSPHVFAASADRVGTLLVKRTPFTSEELSRLHEICRVRKFSVLFSPRGQAPSPVAIVLGRDDPAAFYREFPVDVRPVYDDRPFFFYTVKPDRLLRDIFQPGKLPLNSFSALVLLALLGIVLALVVAGILLPLWLGRRGSLAGRSRSKLRDLLFFICLGVGYILIEIALLNRFSLYLGHPTHALRVVLFALLLFSGLGSLVSSVMREPARWPLLLGLGGALVTACATAYALLLGPLLHATLAWSLAGRMALSVALVAPLALAMGVMLPTGMRLLTRRHQEIVPWAWGLNGAASVLGSVLAMVLAIHLGFTLTLIAGASCYLLALAAGLRSPAAAG